MHARKGCALFFSASTRTVCRRPARIDRGAWAIACGRWWMDRGVRRSRRQARGMSRGLPVSRWGLIAGIRDGVLSTRESMTIDRDVNANRRDAVAFAGRAGTIRPASVAFIACADGLIPGVDCSNSRRIAFEAAHVARARDARRPDTRARGRGTRAAGLGAGLRSARTGVVSGGTGAGSAGMTRGSGGKAAGRIGNRAASLESGGGNRTRAVKSSPARDDG